MFRTFQLNVRLKHVNTISHSYYKSVARTFQKNISLYFSWNIYEVFRKCSILMFKTFWWNVQWRHSGNILLSHCEYVARTFQRKRFCEPFIKRSDNVVFTFSEYFIETFNGNISTIFQRCCKHDVKTFQRKRFSVPFTEPSGNISKTFRVKTFQCTFHGTFIKFSGNALFICLEHFSWTFD